MPNLLQRIEAIERKLVEQKHNGVDGLEVSVRDLVDMFEVVSAAPSSAPKRVGDQVKIYTNGATFRLYWYDQSAAVWHYVTATA